MKFKKASWKLLVYLNIYCIFIMILMFIFIANSIVYFYIYYKTGVFKWSFNDVFDDIKNGTITGIYIGTSIWILIKIDQIKGIKTNIPKKNNNLFICPCCKNYVFHKEGKGETCPICGWIDDPLQSLDPNYKNGWNKISLNQAKAEFKQKDK
ncbi:CPCC family cysteine-rich protein [Orbaceae bacterium ESL0721]|nr:CPCC family cysteine-rich protein [Orbaceae bacterium ESL0721]